MTYRIRVPGTAGSELTFESREAVPAILKTGGMRLPFARPGAPMVIGMRQRRQQQRAAAAASARGPLARGTEPAAPGAGPRPSDDVLDDERL